MLVFLLIVISPNTYGYVKHSCIFITIVISIKKLEIPTNMKKTTSIINDSEEKFECKLFRFLKPAELDQLEQSKSVINYRKGETIIKQGAFVSNIILVQSGLAKLYLEGNNGKSIVVRLIHPDQFVGLSDLYNETHNFTVVALSDVVSYQYRKDVLRKLIGANPVFSAEILKWYSEYYRFLYQKIFSIGTKQMHGRLSDVILYLASPTFNGYDVYSVLARKDIAEMAGMSTESAIRLLTEFKNDGLITSEGKGILINNLELLQRLSQVG
jgi:CRP-like cAMP-binding protein